MKYNLLEEKWIPVLWRNGNSSRVGIREALAQAGEIRQVAASNPMDRVAILRFLLALLYWCRENPPDDKDSISSFPSDWFKKLDDHKDCFNLLGDGKRFYQDRAAKRIRPITVLTQEVPAGNNFWHLRHSTDNKTGLCPPCCAIGLTRLPMFSVSGLSGPGEPNLMAGINGAPPVYVVPWRESLLETLLANWSNATNLGEPSWAERPTSQDPNSDIPLLTGLTLVPRRVFLHDPVMLRDACMGCGASGWPLVLKCDFQTAGKLENDKWRDPHAVYLEGEARKTIRAADLTAPGRFRMDRPWPDLIARLLETGKCTTLLVVGFATNKAKNVDVWERTLDMRGNAPASEAVPAWIRNWRLKGWALEKRIEKIIRSEVEGAALIAAIRPQVEAQVSEKMAELIAGRGDAWEQAAEEYSPMMTAVAKSLSPGYTTTALRRRFQIANVKPDMRPKPGADEKASRKKRGDR